MDGHERRDSATVTSAALTNGVTYSVVLVLNQNPSGTPLFGYDTFGSVDETLFGDFSWSAGTWLSTGLQNAQVGVFTMPENGVITDLQLNVRILPAKGLVQFVKGMIHSSSGGTLGALVTESPFVRVNDPLGEPVGGRNVDAWLTLPVTPTYALAGEYGLGYVGSGDSGVMKVGYETTGGTRRTKQHAVGAPGGTYPNFSAPETAAPNPFGTPGSSDSRKISIYANYTPTTRTGNEGQAYIYVNGALSGTPQNYTSGIADNANALARGTTGALVTMDEFAIWDRVLSNVEVTNLYRMR